MSTPPTPAEVRTPTRHGAPRTCATRQRLPGFSRPDFGGDPWEERERWHRETTDRHRETELRLERSHPPRFVPASRPDHRLFHWLYCWFAFCFLVSLIAAGGVIYALVHFWPTLQRVSEMAGV